MTDLSKRDSMEATVSDLKTKMETTHLSAAASKQRRPLGLTDLPPSVRNRIYAHVLDTELVNAGQPNVAYAHAIKDGVLHFSASRRPFPVSTSMFYVNKQIGQEAREYFYEKGLWVRFEVYSADARHAKTMLEDSGVLFATAAPAVLERCMLHAMDLTLVEKGSAQKRALVMFPAQYLPRLINFMEQASRASGTWAPSHKLWMSVLNTYALEVARVQGDLLELFRLLTNVGGVTVEKGNLLEGYAEALQASILAAEFTAEAWLGMVSETAERAEDVLRGKRDVDAAAQQAQSAIIAMTYGYLTRAETLHSQPEDFHKSIQRLRWRCELALGRALAAKHADTPNKSNASWLSDTSIPLQTRKAAAKDLLAAETATSHALSLATDSASPASNPWFQTLPPELIPPNKAEWFTDEERGRTWYACGIVHTALGECLFAAGDLERAERLWPGGEKEGVKEAFARAREGIDWNVRPGVGLKRAAGVAREE
ncbi:hypothetical protein BU26DRAFT_558266 [Trematosphaeria pertusa]|uniref:Uncharacterized protein n=1 Tax=Trematosphaeria pertusa TaxID=390896 RepID=A0A6A6J367_9PLEO|nr:uncharacterized protein BU26DRAFT_558266 [Trematosphaeria pertusa]KAF2256831.1 hypothetical protein BU26DRAFT_558266 [Trematosphaeria pertusa]